MATAERGQEWAAGGRSVGLPASLKGYGEPYTAQFTKNWDNGRLRDSTKIIQLILFCGSVINFNGDA